MNLSNNKLHEAVICLSPEPWFTGPPALHALDDVLDIAFDRLSSMERHLNDELYESLVGAA